MSHANYAPPPSYYPAPQPFARPVAGLGIATQVLLVVQLAAAVGLLFPVLHERHLIGQIKDDPGSVTLQQAQHADNTVTAMATLVLVLFIATGIVWIFWFHRLRTNVEAWRPVYQRLSAGWAIGGWFCPIVNLWFPYMIARDVLDDTERGSQDSWAYRGARPLILVWWLSYVALFVLGLVERGTKNATTLDGLTHFTDVEIVAVVARIASAVLAVAVVRRLTGAQERRRAVTVTAAAA